MGGCAGKSVGLSALPGCSHRLSWDFPSRLARAREEGARFVSRPASGTFPPKLPEPRPKPPPSWPRPPLSPWRRPASAATAALSSRGCRGGARKPHAWSCRRLPRTQVSVARSGAHPAWSGAAPRVCGRRRRLLRAPGCLRKDPPRSCPPRCLPSAVQDPRCPGRGGAGRVVSTSGPPPGSR